MHIDSAVDICTDDSIQYGNMDYSMPSAWMREHLNIVNTDGYHYFNKHHEVLAEYTIAEKTDGSTQKYVLAGKEDVQDLMEKNQLDMLWIMQETRKETETMRERLDVRFIAEHTYYYIAYQKRGKLVVEKLQRD